MEILSANFIGNHLIGKFISTVAHDVATSMYIKQWEADFIWITTSGFIHEIEIKRSRSDFKADFFKTDGQDLKHDLIKNGEYGLRSFSFIAPYGILKTDDIPDYCGFYQIDTDGQIGTSKPPVRLKNPVKITSEEKNSLFNYYKFKFLKQAKKDRRGGF